MKFAEIERKFSEKVAGFLSDGYVISAATMRGTEREFCKVDLRKGNELVRIMIIEDFLKIGLGERFEDLRWFNRVVDLVVSKMEISGESRGMNEFRSFWNSDFEVCDKQRWVKIADDWFVNEDEAAPMSRVHGERLQMNSDRHNNALKREFSGDYNRLFVKLARKQKGMKTVKPGEVTGIKYYDGWPVTQPGYYVRARGSEVKIS